jgi:hypothetical protein
MGMPSCFPNLNLQWFLNVQASISGAGTAEELQQIISTAFADIAPLNSTIESQLAYLAPIEALLTAPLNPAEVITWVSNFITGFLGPYYAPQIQLTAQLASIITQIAALTALAEEVASAKFPGITINFPSVAPFCSI